MKTYPQEHKEIVSALLDGKFLLQNNIGFTTLEEQQDEYREFFKVSFGHELIMDAEIAYLCSSDVNEKDTRNFTLFIAILCRELDLVGKDFRQEIFFCVFDLSNAESLLRQSSKWEILERIISEDLSKFLSPWIRRNVVQRVGNSGFRFTKAVKIFFEFASSIAQNKLNESNSV